MTTGLLAIVFTVFSPSFEDGGFLPIQFTGYGKNISPELVLENLSDKAKYLTVSFCDEDMPFIDEYCHWVCWNIPATNRIPENIPAGSEINEPFHAIQGIGYGRHKSRGPKPPFHAKHNYHFTVYVLDTELNLPPSSTLKDVKKAMEGHILQQNTIRCWYQKGNNDKVY
ncbi:MAG: YbhB/YbcL family Raf kinase inhibitor-like protein [Spirochaetales bacterium]|nr:YbhB/YbcL family Raf kinase inhibitor-like protein [Spirochaetales bacterium]